MSTKLQKNLRKANDSTATRKEILSVLQQSEKDKAAYEVAEEVSVVRQTVVNHLKEMAENGTVRVTREIGGIPMYEKQ